MKVYFTLFFIISCASFSAQEIKKTQDLGFWLSASMEYKFNKNYNLKFSQDVRLFESLSELDKYISDLALEYKINKKFKLGTNVRYYLNKEKNKTFSQNWRYNFDLKFKEKINEKFNFKYRLRFQSTYKDLFGEISKGEKSNLRNKISLDYKVNKKHSLYFSTELFREIIVYRRPYFNKTRLLIGDKMKANIGAFDYSIGYERELNSDHPLNYIFARINYTFKLKHEK